MCRGNRMETLGERGRGRERKRERKRKYRGKRRSR